MLIWTILKVALKSLLGNKLRTVLAMLGIIIGVGAVISMLALGAGAQAQVMDRITAMGTNLLVVRPGGDRRGGVRSGSGMSLDLKDALALVEEVPGIAMISPAVRGRAQVKYFNENTNTSINGVAATYLPIRNFAVERGRAFTALEEERAARVAVVGPATTELLFGGADPLGERIRIGSVNFQVIGVLESKGDQGWYNPDEMVLIPYTTAMKQILGQDHLHEISVQARAGTDLKEVEESIAAVLRRRHRIPPGGDDDFHVRNQAEIIEVATTVTRTFTILLGGIAGISLLVGGIGIMNIMLVTVTERTREIGVRKAIGARNRDILRQFLLEAVLISGIGGALGVGFGFGVAFLVRSFSEFETRVQPASVLLALLVSGSVGIVFGYLPARRAARLDPIDALRYE